MKSPTKQWQNTIIPGEMLHKIKEKCKSKKKAISNLDKNKTLTEKTQDKTVRSYVSCIKEKTKKRGLSAFDIRIHTDQKEKTIPNKSKLQKKPKFRMSTVVKDFMQSETYKLLIEKRKNINEGSKSKEDINGDENKEEENDASKETEDSPDKTPDPGISHEKRRGILFRSSTLQQKQEHPANVTPPPRAYQMPGLDVFRKNYMDPMSLNLESKSSSASVSSTDSPKTKRSRNKEERKKRVFSNTKVEKQQINFFVHKAPRLTLLEKKKIMQKRKTNNLAPLNARFTLKFNAQKKFPSRRDTFTEKPPISQDIVRKLNKTRISKLRTSRMVIAQNETNKMKGRNTFISPVRQSKLPTNISIPLETIVENKTPKNIGMKSIISPIRIPNKSKQKGQPSPVLGKLRFVPKRPRRHLSNNPTLRNLF
mmetsp:Transcript_27369/g.27239  ORF Transcript_27369/g.27239 Transcript_27369/m.27239 type:complete len:423 (-) Transcript_27369:13-1281(-)